MLTNIKTLKKIGLIEERYSKLRYETIELINFEMCETLEHLYKEPCDNEKVNWCQVDSGTLWGGNKQTGWFRGDVTLSPIFEGKKVFICAKTGGETLFYVDGQCNGVFDRNHPVVMMTNNGVTGKSYHISLEAYSGHYVPSYTPGIGNRKSIMHNESKLYEGVNLLLEREDVSAFVFDIRVLRQVVNVLDESSLRRNKIIRGLAKIFAIVDAIPDETEEESWRSKLVNAREIMSPLLEAKNGSTIPMFGIMGHSHLDTAWLWSIAETCRKCARTFSSILNLMEQYPEFKFFQSSPYHVFMMKEKYPDIYQRICKMVKEGRWEPNGAMWIESDCNLPSGESLVRQMLIGQYATRELYGYTSDTLWLPDDFGFPASLPQIMRGSGVQFFCTNKLSRNDTNRFPYDTFIWKGADGTSVLSHFPKVDWLPDPENLQKSWEGTQHKDFEDRGLLLFGYGDGGGGPTNEMIESARRVKNLEGCPRTKVVTVSSFMKEMQDELTDLPQWTGELYFEAHRGTLTSLALIKRLNRKTEFALRDAEFLSTLAALNGQPYPVKQLRDIWSKFLINQFHDILPGSSIAEVNDEAIKSLNECFSSAIKISRDALNSWIKPQSNIASVLVINNLSWDRDSEFILDCVPEGKYINGNDIKAQWFEDIEGHAKLAVTGFNVPALGCKILTVSERQTMPQSAFKVSENVIETPYAILTFDAYKRIISFIDIHSQREIVKKGSALNTFWIGEDIPEFYDNWDIDIDQKLKMSMEKGFISSGITADGPIQLRIRSHYKIGSKSSMIQDMVFHADSARVDFETAIEWKEKHTLLKAGFDMDILTDFARNEIQYGYVERPTHSNLPQDRARFEVCNHKWTDLSEPGFGVTLINDCKYGIGLDGGELRLSLMKSGLGPDTRGEEGPHLFNYSILPHQGGFSVESVVRPAYEVNISVINMLTSAPMDEFKGIIEVDQPNIIVESIKWAENQNAFVVRIYEAGKTGGKVNLKFNISVKTVSLVNLLEENPDLVEMNNDIVSLYLRPFEIKTLLCYI